jgi:hypothetical protein
MHIIPFGSAVEASRTAEDAAPNGGCARGCNPLVDHAL